VERVTDRRRIQSTECCSSRLRSITRKLQMSRKSKQKYLPLPA
jgi:hypothetical protein